MTTTTKDSPEASGTNIVEVSLISLFVFSAAALVLLLYPRLTVNWLLPSAFLTSSQRTPWNNSTTPLRTLQDLSAVKLSPATERCGGCIKCGIDTNWLQEISFQDLVKPRRWQVARGV